MQDIFLDTRVELDAAALGAQADPVREVIDICRQTAEERCARDGARLRTDRAPEVIVTRGQSKATGQLCVLVAMRWACVAPEGVTMGPPR